jgi:transposase
VDRGRPKSEAARTFGVSRSSVKPYAAARREGRPLSPRKHPKHPGSEPKLDERARKILQADVEARPATTLKDRCRFLQEALGVWVSESTLSRLLRKIGFSPKDGACSRARTRRVLEGRLARPGLRQAEWEALHGKRFVFVDECSSNTSLSPIYGWSRKGKRVCFQTPRNWGTNLTLLSSMSVEGMGASMVVEGSTTKAVFETYAERVLAPVLTPGQVVVMEDLSSHKGSRVRELVEGGRGCELLSFCT